MQKIKTITRKRIITFAVIAVLIIVVFSIVRSCRKGSVDKFEYEDVNVGKVEKTISVTGVLDVNEQEIVQSKTAGIIKKIYVEFNQEVKKGQLLAEVDTSDLDPAMNKMAAQGEALKIEITIAREDLESKRSMFKENLISEKGMERAESNYKTVILKQRQFMVDYDTLKKQKSNSRITSPVSGILLNMMAKEKAPIAMNTPLFLIVPNLKKMKLSISVDESDVGIVKEDQRVFFTVSAFPEKTFTGEISEVHMTPVLKGGLVTYDSYVICDNSELLLKPGMTATATIEIDKRENVLRVPNQALLVNPQEGKSEPEKNTVWRKSESLSGKLPVEKVKVEVGLHGDTFTEIKKNLKKGDKVLIKYMKSAKGSGK